MPLLQKIQSALKHGGPLRMAEIFSERLRHGYSFRSFTYSWPKNLRVHWDTNRPEREIFLILPEVPSTKPPFGGIATALSLADEKTKQGFQIQLVDHSVSSETLELRCHPKAQFWATAWWTRHTLATCPEILSENITYLVQDYEPCFYDPLDPVELLAFEAAKETYNWPAHFLINSQFLADYLTLKNIVPEKARLSWTVFPPKIREDLFLPLPKSHKLRQVFVYARPEVRRNRFDLIVQVLNECVDFIPEDVELLGVGTLKKDILLSKNRKLKAVERMPLEKYAQMVRESPLGICLMEAPHPSYPPLELATAGNWVVCNRWETKDLSSLGPLFLSAELKVGDLSQKFCEGLKNAFG